MIRYDKLIKLSFWFFCLPLVGFEALYFYLNNLNPLESSIFLCSISICFPMMMLKKCEFEDNAYNEMLEEFRNMTTHDFLEREHEIMSLPPLRDSAMFKEAYRQVYEEKMAAKLREYPLKVI